MQAREQPREVYNSLLCCQCQCHVAIFSRQRLFPWPTRLKKKRWPVVFYFFFSPLSVGAGCLQQTTMTRRGGGPRPCQRAPALSDTTMSLSGLRLK